MGVRGERVEPRLAAVEPALYVAVHAAGAGACFGDAHGGCAGSVRARPVPGHGQPSPRERAAPPRVVGRRVFAARRNVFRRAKEAEMQVIVMGAAGLAADHGEAVAGRSARAEARGCCEQRGAQVLDDEDALKRASVVRFALEQGLEQAPRAFRIEGEGHIVAWIREVPEIHAAPLLIEEGGPRLGGAARPGRAGRRARRRRGPRGVNHGAEWVRPSR